MANNNKKNFNIFLELNMLQQSIHTNGDCIELIEQLSSIVEAICTYTYVRWASEPSATVQYFGVVGEVNITVVVAADGVMLTGFDYRRITHSQQTVFTYTQQRD